MRLKTNEMKDLVRTMHAVSGESQADGVMTSLLALAQVLPPRGAKREWDTAFRFLGKLHCNNLNRFDIIAGIYKALLECDPETWIRTWMLSLKAAAIHPVSLLLCCPGNAEAHQEMIASAFHKLNQEYWWMVNAVDRTRGRSIYTRAWELQLYPEVFLDNVLSTEPIIVESMTPYDRLMIGSKWCVYALTLIAPSPGYDPGFIANDLTTITDLELRYCFGPMRVQPTIRVGGIVSLDGRVEHLLMGENCYEADKGIQFRKEQYWTRFFKLHPIDRPIFQDPIIIPESLGSMLMHHGQHALWWNPK